MKKPFGKTKFGKLLKGLVREGLQTVPMVGTVVTAFKEDTPENPKGTIKLTSWHYYRIAIGVIAGYLMFKGILTEEQIEIITSMIGF
jgi:hypothetical protein